MPAHTSPAYQFNIGEIVETYDNSIGMITDRTSAHDFMAFEKQVKDPSIRAYMNVAIYKVLIGGKISYVSESNIRGVVTWKKEKE